MPLKNDTKLFCFLQHSFSDIYGFFCSKIGQRASLQEGQNNFAIIFNLTLRSFSLSCLIKEENN